MWAGNVPAGRAGGAGNLPAYKEWALILFADTRRVLLLGILLVVGSAYFWRLDSGELKLDNIYYAALSKEVSQGNGFPVPQLAGYPYLKKPPLFFWLNGLIMKIGGASVPSARFLSLIAACTVLFLLFVTVRTITGLEEPALSSAFILAITYGFFRNARACRMETLLLTFILGAGLSLSMFFKRGRISGLYGWALCCGLAILTKGVPGIPPVAVGLWLLVTRRKNKEADPIPWTHVLGAFFLLLLVSAWWFLVTARFHPRFFQVFLGQEILQRMGLNGGTGHIRFEDLSTLKLGKDFLTSYLWFLPFVWVGWVHAQKAGWTSRPLFRFFLLVAAVQVAGSLMVSTRYGRYLLPLYLFLAVPAGIGFSRMPRYVKHGVPLVFGMLSIMWMLVSPGRQKTGPYRVLEQVKKEADAGGRPVIVDPEWFRYWEHKAAAVFYLNRMNIGKPTPGSLYVTYPGKSPGRGSIAYRSDELQVLRVRARPIRGTIPGSAIPSSLPDEHPRP